MYSQVPGPRNRDIFGRVSIILPTTEAVIFYYFFSMPLTYKDPPADDWLREVCLLSHLLIDLPLPIPCVRDAMTWHLSLVTILGSRIIQSILLQEESMVTGILGHASSLGKIAVQFNSYNQSVQETQE